MQEATKIEDVDDVKLWIAGYQGADEVKTKVQGEFNKRVESRVYSLENRVSAIERRIMWISGVAAALGSIVGTKLPSVFGG